MNAPATFPRIAARREAERSLNDKIASLIVSASVGYKNAVNGRDEDLHKLVLLDAVARLVDADLRDDIQGLRDDLRIDNEGYPLTDAGDRDWNAERVFVPASERLEQSYRAVREGGGL